jgi:DNA-binding CsgD family transcriptional regulator/tetratricopeptide (TPR) repeat protein
VVPGRAELRLVEAVVDPSPGQLTECIRQGLLRVEGTDVSFRHELVRQAVESSLDAASRRRLNRLVLAELSAISNPARLVHHALEAGDFGSIVEFAPQAARAAMEVGSVREAGAHFRNLEPHLDLIPEGERARIVDDWARTEFMLDNPESLDILDRAMDLYRAVGDEDSLARALTFGVRSNENNFRPEAAERCAVEALAILEPKPPGPDLAFALAQRAWLGMVRWDDDVAVEYADRAIDMARETGDDLSLIHSLNTKGCTPGEPDGLTLLEEARWRAQKGRHRFEEVRALGNMSVSAMERMDLDRAGEFSQRAMEAAARHEIPVYENSSRVNHASVLLARGDLTTAESLVLEAIGSSISRTLGLEVLARIQTRRGQAAAKESVLRSWLLSEASGQPQYLTPAAALLAEYMWLTDDHPVGSPERLRQVMHSAKIRLWSVGALAWWLWELGELDSVPDGIAPGFALTMNGDARAGAAEWDRLGYPYEKAMALTHADAEGRLEALEILETLGATAVAAKVRRGMRADGITVPRGRAKATRRHPAGLTARQAEVLTLLDQGLTNVVIADRLFVSPRTVENHVSAILAKLDVPTREAAVETARAASLVPA